jgi:hypothetical protein
MARTEKGVLEQDELLDKGGVKRATEENSVPAIVMDDAYRERAARRIEQMTGRLPLWYTATPQELAEVIWQQWENDGLEGPDVPLEALRRENLYD